MGIEAVGKVDSSLETVGIYTKGIVESVVEFQEQLFTKCCLSFQNIAHWSKAIVGGTPKIRHRFPSFLDFKARNL